MADVSRPLLSGRARGSIAKAFTVRRLGGSNVVQAHRKRVGVVNRQATDYALRMAVARSLWSAPLTMRQDATRRQAFSVADGWRSRRRRDGLTGWNAFCSRVLPRITVDRGADVVRVAAVDPFPPPDVRRGWELIPFFDFVDPVDGARVFTVFARDDRPAVDVEGLFLVAGASPAAVPIGADGAPVLYPGLFSGSVEAVSVSGGSHTVAANAFTMVGDGYRPGDDAWLFLRLAWYEVSPGNPRVAGQLLDVEDGATVPFKLPVPPAAREPVAP